jgi:hypothetical protein
VTQCDVNGDGGIARLCNNPCDNPEFPYISSKNHLCYSTFELANAGTGPCDSWCTNDVKFVDASWGCADASVKLCNNPCKNPEYLYTNANGLCYPT